MKNVKIIHTEMGTIPVVINETILNGDLFYNGTILGEDDIIIFKSSEEDCILDVIMAFRTKLHFWVRSNLADLQLEYEK